MRTHLPAIVLGGLAALAGCTPPNQLAPPATFAIQGQVVGATIQSEAQADTQAPRWDLKAIADDPAPTALPGASQVVAAVIDTGVDPRQPELQGRILPMIDMVGPDRYHSSTGEDLNYQGKDGNGHGTHVTGIIHAVLGATAVRILPIKAINYTGVGDDGTIASGIRYATDWRDGDRRVRVINLSIGGKTSSSTLEDALAYAAARDVLVVVAAGNRSRDVDYPAALPSALAVSATTLEDGLASYSNRGRTVGIAAPGGDGAMPVTSTWPSYLTAVDRNRGLTMPHVRGDMAGTSMAAPHVTGAAGLLFAQDPSLSAAQVRARLEAWSDDLGPLGPDGYFGVGRLNVAGALSKGSHDAR